VRAHAALNAFFLIDRAESVLIHGDGIDRTGPDARPDGFRNGVVRAGLRAHAAFPAFVMIDVHPVLSFGNRSEMAGIHAGFPQAVLAVAGYGKTLDGTVFAGRGDDLDDILRIVSARADALCKTDPLPDNLPLPVDAAAKLRLRSRNHFIGKGLFLFFQLSLPGKSCHFQQDFLRDFKCILIVSDHAVLSPSAPVSVFQRIRLQ